MKWLSEAENHLNTRRLPLTWDNLDHHIQQQPARTASSLHQIPWAKLLHCLNRDIFKRLWCVQEIILARSNDVRTSKSRIDIGVLACSARLIFQALEDLNITSPTASVLQSKTNASSSDIRRLTAISGSVYIMLMTAPLPCLEFKRETGPIKPVSALSIINSNSGRECTHPRDHVYGLAALCGSGHLVSDQLFYVNDDYTGGFRRLHSALFAYN